MPGMTKEQVTISLGYPRTDMTPSTDRSEWHYGARDGEEYIVIWGPDQRLQEIVGPPNVTSLVVYAK